MPIQLPGGSNLELALPQRADGYILLAVLALAALALFFGSLGTFRGLSRRQWALFLVLLLAGISLNAVLLVPVSVMLPAMPQATDLPPAPLLGLLCVLLAGAWAGIGPAMLVGAASGAARWLLAAGRITQPAEIALLAWLAAFLMQQNYRGWAARGLRRPIVAAVVAAATSLVIVWPAVYAAAPGDALSAFDFIISTFIVVGLLALGEGILNGLVAHVASLAFPSLRRSATGTETPFYARSLNRRLLLTILPITFFTITFQVVVVGLTALTEARQQAVAQLSRSAQVAADLLDSFFVDGRAALEQFATDEQLQGADHEAQQAQLAAALSTVAFFDELLLVDANGQIVASARVDIPGSATVALTGEEVERLPRVLTSGAPLRTGVHADANGLAMISFVQPMGSGAAARGALIGRTRLSINPRIDVIKRNLADTPDLGVGYLVDENNRIVVHPNPDLELSQWIFDRDQSPVEAPPGGGAVYIDVSADNTRRFIFVQEASGTPWTVAIERPYIQILSTAAQISAPLVVMFAVIMLGALVLLPLIGRRVTQPLSGLAQEAGRITRGELDRPVADMGEDEVGRLGGAFERMRQSLKARMDELSLLLRVSESVAASLDLERGLPPILEAALQVTSQSISARVARVIALDDERQPARVIARGDGPAQVTPLDSALAEMTVRDERPLQIENVARSRGAIDPGLTGPGLRSIIALPLRRSGRALGVMWLGFPEPRRFAEYEVSLLATLAGQAAVFIENVGLFEAAEGGRQRLQAVLTSTNDAVLVTDGENRILLCNPAAEIAFGIAPGTGVGRPVDEAVGNPIVIDLLTEGGEPSARTAEVPMPDGRTLYGSAASIASGDGQRIGRVAVLRDITHLKELDALKNEFVNTVSHDLRSPLTYMRGYVTMVPMVGRVEAKQQEYLDKITAGIEQMTALIDDLLDLGRIEAGVGIVRDTASLSELAREAIDSMQGLAAMRKTTLQLEAQADVTLRGDRQLIKHAIVNLIDNALKYTPAGGLVRVSVDERDGQAIVQVRDNGIGIAPSDQPRLFEKFYRIRRRDTLDVKGTGLGLAIVKSIAEWHHGRVWVESQLGQGATFTIALPIER